MPPPDIVLSSDMDAFLVTANDAAARAELGAVGTTGNETISGIKTFSSPFSITDTTASSFTTSGGIVSGLGITATTGTIQASAGSVFAGSANSIGIGGRGGFRAMSDAVFQLRNNANTDFGSLSLKDATLTGSLTLPKTITPAGTTGAQTINNMSGSVNFAAAAGSLVVTNSLVSTSSVIQATVTSNDGQMKSVSAVPAAGSFTLRGNASPTSECRVDFLVTN